MSEHAPGPWEAKNRSGAGWQIDCVLPAGFKFDGTARGADGQKSFMTWTVREAHTVQIADERWVQFSTGSWEKMQAANARLIAAAPDMLAALKDVYEHIADPARSPRDLYPAFGLNSGYILEAVAAAIAKATQVSPTSAMRES